MLNDIQYKLAKQEGAIEFCNFLRGRVPPEQLLDAWNSYSAVSTAEIRMQVPNPAADGKRVSTIIREAGL